MIRFIFWIPRGLFPGKHAGQRFVLPVITIVDSVRVPDSVFWKVLIMGKLFSFLDGHSLWEDIWEATYISYFLFQKRTSVVKIKFEPDIEVH